MSERVKIYKHVSRYFSSCVIKRMIYCLLQVLNNILSLATPFIYVQLINKIMLENKIQYLKDIVAAIVLIYIVSSIINYALVKYRNSIFLDLETNLQKELLNRYLYMPYEKFRNYDLGDLKKIIVDDVSKVNVFIDKNIIQYVISILIMCILSIILFKMSFILALIAILFIPISFWITNKLGENAKKITEIQRKIQGDYEKELFNILGFWETIKHYQLIKEIVEKINVYWQVLADYILKKQMISFKNRFFLSFKNYVILEMGLYFLGGILIFNNKLEIEHLIAFMSYLSVFLKYVTDISNDNFEYNQNIPLVNNIICILNVEQQESLKLKEFSELYFDDVSLLSKDTKTIILDKINLKIKKGEHVVIAGHNGSGKSSLLKAIIGMQPESVGNILVNNIPINNLDEKEFYKMIRYLPQNPHFISGSIKDNLLICDANLSEKEMQQVCEKVGLLDFICSLPDRFDTNIGVGGIKLSGGQKQRLAIARILLTNPEVLILDEITASMDEKSSMDIERILMREFADRTIVMVSHKWSEIVMFPRVLFMNLGRLVSDTSNQEVMHNSLKYKKMLEKSR